MTKLDFDKYSLLLYRIVGAAFDVHKELKSGLAEAIYEEALCIELTNRGIKTINQVDVPVFYKGVQLKKHYRLDVLVEDEVIIEIKATDEILAEHRAQLFNYLRLTHKPIGLLLNFGQSVEVERYIYDVNLNKVSYFSKDYDLDMIKELSSINSK